jgi:hypothetical protein
MSARRIPDDIRFFDPSRAAGGRRPGLSRTGGAAGLGRAPLRRPARDTLPSTLINKPAPKFDLPLLHSPDIRITPETLAGAPYVLNVWGSWCPACAEEHPVLTRFALTKRVRVVGYDWKDKREDACMA